VLPWQHMLDPLAGYLMMTQVMVTDPDGVSADRARFPLGVGTSPGESVTGDVL
jgi:hypothetical protein